MRKILNCMPVVMLLACSFVLVSCSPSSDKTEEMNPVTGANVVKDVTEVAATVGKIASADDKDSEEYQKSESVTIKPTKTESFSFVSSSATTDMTPAMVGETDPSSQTSNVAEFQYVTYILSYKNKAVVSGADAGEGAGAAGEDEGEGTVEEEPEEYELSLLSQTIRYKLKDGTEDENYTLAVGDLDSETGFNDCAAMQQIHSIIDSLSSNDGKVVLDKDSINGIVSFVQKYEPVFTYETEFGSEENNKGKVTLEFTLNAETDGSISISLKSAEVKVGNEVILKAKNSKVKLTLSSDFSVPVTIKYSQSEGIEFKTDVEDIKGTATVTFNKLPVTLLDSKEILVDGTASYDFTNTKIKFNLDGSLCNASGNEYLGAGFTFEAKLDELEEPNDWYNILSGFKFTSFRYNGTNYDTESVMDFIKLVYGETISEKLQELFGSTVEKLVGDSSEI